MSSILILSPAFETAAEFIARAKAHPSPPSDASEPPLQGKAAQQVIPWTITNKYYSADVQFEVREAAHAHTALEDSESAPAVVFVWSSGQPFKPHLISLSKTLSSMDPEVSLAVRLRTHAPVPDSEDEDNLDEFISDLGLEFVDVHPHATDVVKDEQPAFDVIPGLPRVIDALSTIMWPSMTTKQRGASAIVTHTTDDSEDHLNSLLSGTDTARVAHDLEELERWLESDADVQRAHDDAWTVSGSENVAPIVMSPTDEHAPHGGFEDDFTVFVSAPAPEAHPVPPDVLSPDASFDTDALTPSIASPLYRSLGSVSDFGGSDDEDDPDIPSRAEIEQTSARIYNPPKPTPGSASVSTGKPGPSDSFDNFPTGEDADFDMSAFDLNRVLGALQGMKAEIAGMTDEGERRKAAARVALGVVYGLEAERGPPPKPVEAST